MTVQMTMNANTGFEVVVAYQAWQDLTSWYKHSGERDTLEMTYLVLGLAGEAGEAADHVKKMLRKEGDEAWEHATPEQRMHLAMEVGDVLWYVTRFCTFFGITVEELMLLNMVKLYKRLNERSESGLKDITWPLTSLSYEDALSLTQRIESRITQASASRSTDTAT